MNKGANKALIVLILLLLACLSFAGYSILEKQKVEQAKLMVEEELEETQKREKTKIAELMKLNEEHKKLNSEKSNLEDKIKKAEAQLEGLHKQVSEAKQDAETVRARLDGARKERDDLLAKFEALSSEKEALEEKIAQFNEESPASSSDIIKPTMPSTQRMPSDSTVISREGAAVDEEYWASVLREKAALEVELERIKKAVSATSIEVVGLKQDNADLQIQLDELEKVKEVVDEQIAYKEEMINKLSVELAHTKNEKKFVETKTDKVQAENIDLRTQIKKLVATKGALEKSIVRLSQEKKESEKKLMETEAIIQGKIDEIWDIKKSLDDTIKSTSFTPPASDVELPPIIVSSDGPAVSFESGITTPGFNGQIVSINEGNNFVIVDIGENSGIRLGDALSVYRDAKYIARLEVIQVRKDIAAADIKDQWTRIQVGDAVR